MIATVLAFFFSRFFVFLSFARVNNNFALSPALFIQPNANSVFILLCNSYEKYSPRRKKTNAKRIIREK